MEFGNVAPRGMVVTPHHLASQSALAILREGGTAMEATIAAAATLAVVYPHMNSIGSDGFWLIIPPHKEPFVIEACGAAGSKATLDFYKGFSKIPYVGPKAAATVAGTVGGWQEALDYVSECGYQKMSTSKLLEDAIKYADEGFAMSSSLEKSLNNFIKKEQVSRDFADVFLPDGKVPKVGERFCQKNLAHTLRYLAQNGFKSFYQGELANTIAEDMSMLGMPITKSDLANYSAIRKKPLRLLHSQGELLNTPPPTQGIVSLAILGMLDKLNIDGQDETDLIHTTVEATKEAFRMRDEFITDPNYMSVSPNDLLSEKEILKMARNINRDHAAVGRGKGPADTIWLGVMDNKGFSVSYIQSVYHQLGSGVVLPKTGILWQNRGTAFTLDEYKLLSIKPGKKPYHTLNPAAAILKDGRVMVYGTRGGDGQPQTQAAVFHRYVIQGYPLQKSISAPRWLFGRIGGDHDRLLKLENRFCDSTVNNLREKGHNVVMLSEYDETVGHAGTLVRHLNGMMEGAFDPRSNGSAVGF